jgi:hypothetical protein
VSLFSSPQVWVCDGSEPSLQNLLSVGFPTQIAQAQADAVSTAAADATTKVSTKVTTFISSTAPTAQAVGDLWMDTANGNLVSRWSGAVWTPVPVGTAALSANAVSLGVTTDTSTTTGSTGTPGSSVRGGAFYGPEVTTETGDELDITVSGRHEETFWSTAAYAEVEIWLTWAASFGGAETEFTTVRKRFGAATAPAGATAYFAIDISARFVPGAATRHLVCKYAVRFFDSAGVAKQCAKDFSAKAQWLVVRRKR